MLHRWLKKFLFFYFFKKSQKEKYYKENTEDTNILGVWWALWVAANIITNQGDGIGASFLGEGLETQTIITIIANVL